MPTIKNEKLRAFLTENNARLLYQVSTNNSILRIYQIHAIIAIVQIWDENDGFDIYIPASTENSIDATFEAVKKKAYCLDTDPKRQFKKQLTIIELDRGISGILDDISAFCGNCANDAKGRYSESAKVYKKNAEQISKLALKIKKEDE